MGASNEIHDREGDLGAYARGSLANDVLSAPRAGLSVAPGENEKAATRRRRTMIAALKNASSQAKAVEWNAYARCYDLLCAINPAYTELLEEFAAFIRKARTSVGARILDLGAEPGTSSPMRFRRR